jgi:hypothetical protein
MSTNGGDAADHYGLSIISNHEAPRSVASTDSAESNDNDNEATRRKQMILNAAKASYNYDDDEEADEDDVEDAEDAEEEKPRKPAAAPAPPKRYSPASSTISSVSGGGIKPSFTRDEVANMKREMLYQIERLERRGVKIRKFTMQSSFDDIKAELDKVKRDRELDASVRFQKMALTTFATGIEFLNSRYDPFDVHLEGWSENISDNINDYDEIFEELHVKYQSKARMAPELKLMMMLGGSAVKFHMTNTLFKSTLPNFNQVMKDNPNLMSAFSEAAMKNMAPPSAAAPSSGGFGNMFGMLGSLFGGASSAPGPAPQQQQQAPTMRGPSNVEDILKDYENGKKGNDYVISTMSDVESVTSEGNFKAAANKQKQSQARRKAAAAAAGTTTDRRTLDI